MNAAHRQAGIVALALILSLGSACASVPVQWDRPGATAADFHADRAYCQMDTKPTMGGDAGLNLLSLLLEPGWFKRCMSDHGWTPRAKVQDE